MKKRGRRDTTPESAAWLHAITNVTDPFAYGRIMLHMERGIENPEEVAADARRLLAAKV